MWALLLMPLFIACDNDNDGANVDGADSVDQLIGAWGIKDDAVRPYNERSIVLQKDGKYIVSDIWYFYTNGNVQYMSEEFKTEGTYKFEGGKLNILTGETLYREGTLNDRTGVYVVSDWTPMSEDEGGKFAPVEISVSLKLGGSLLVLSQEGVSNPAFFVKEGTKMSSDKSALKGTWLATVDYNKTTYTYAVKFDADSLDYVDSYWKDRYIAAYDFKDGYVTPSLCVCYGWNIDDDEDEDDGFNMSDLFDNKWEKYDDDDYYLGSFPFIVDGKIAYALVDSEFLTFKKK